MQPLHRGSESLGLSLVDPLVYPEWNQSILCAHQSSPFHTANWVRVLQESYGYQPYYFTCFRDTKLAALLPFMEVRSWITGVRGVSLPFSDYCPPIVNEKLPYSELLGQVIVEARRLKWKFLEIRGGNDWFHDVVPYISYYRNILPLSQDEEKVYSRLRSNYRAKIRKAPQLGLKVNILRSQRAMAEYYRLHSLTRKRLGLPPQPAVFFDKIYEYIIAKNLGFVTLVEHEQKPVAGAVFFCFGQRAMYKFGASDAEYQHLYPNYLLFWHAIQWLCQNECQELCFGRTASNNIGLIQFKDGWGTYRNQINYYRYNLNISLFVQRKNKPVYNGFPILKKLPIKSLQLIGNYLYRHVA